MCKKNNTHAIIFNSEDQRLSEWGKKHSFRNVGLFSIAVIDDCALVQYNDDDFMPVRIRSPPKLTQ